MAELILALDLERRDEALRLLDRLPEVRWVKVGSILMTAAGPDFVVELRERGHEVFLDLKWHDIPNTVAGAVRAAGRLGVRMVTVHTLGGGPMLEAASRAAPEEMAVVGVTVLTSHSAGDLAQLLGRDSVRPEDEVSRLGALGIRSGLAGLVCSPLEVARLRGELGPKVRLVVPGIRTPGDAAGDQTRTATAREAARAGATHLVVGRPVLQAPDPAEAWARLAEEAQTP